MRREQAIDKKDAGEYTVECVEGDCPSDAVRWKRVFCREVVGEVIGKGVVTQTYSRAVSVDRQTLTITFHDPQTKRKMSLQTWRKQERAEFGL